MKRINSLLLTVYFLILFLFILSIHFFYLDGIPHVPDDVAYLFMANMFAQGTITAPIPVSPEHFDFFPGILSVEKGTWFFQYTFGHPLLLSIGAFLNIPSLIPALLGTSTIVLLYLSAQKMYSTKTALLLLPLPLMSPFFLENAASFMSHTSAAFYITCAFFCYVTYVNRHDHPLILTYGMGIFLGFLFNTRPLTALPFLILFGVFLLFSKHHHIQKMYALLLFGMGFATLLLLWFTYNSILTGSPFSSQYYTVNQGIFGVGEESSLQTFLTERMRNVQVLFTNLLPMLFNLPVLITCLLFVPFVFIKRKNMFDVYLICAVLTLPLAYFFYNGTFLMYGPRFWYEILPFVFLLTARGLTTLFEKHIYVTSGVFLFLFLFSLGRLFSIFPSVDPDPNSPLALERLRGFNFTDNRIYNEVQKNNIHNAVVLVGDCQGQWWCFGSVFWRNNHTLTTDIVYAKDLGEKNTVLFSYFPKKTFYTISYNHPILIKLPRQ